MSFVYPAFLFAASLIAIPVIIHLFNFRRYKTVYFSNVQFLKEVIFRNGEKYAFVFVFVIGRRFERELPKFWVQLPNIWAQLPKFWVQLPRLWA